MCELHVPGHALSLSIHLLKRLLARFTHRTSRLDHRLFRDGIIIRVIDIVAPKSLKLRLFLLLFA
jgi:hypothetical protein